MDKRLEIEVEELPETYRDLHFALSEVLEPDAAMMAVLKIAETFGGESPYFQKLEALERVGRNRRIIEEYRAGDGYRTLARRHALSVRFIRDVISRGLSEK